MSADPTARRVRKAVIPAAGLGTRFLPATKAQPKEMLPVVDKPAIQYVVEEALRAGLDDILIITARGKRSIEDHFDRSWELEDELASRGKHDLLKEVRAIGEMADVHYVRQGEAKGLGHAVSMARTHVGSEPFAVLLGDDIFTERSTVLADMLAAYGRYGDGVVALKKVPRQMISSYGCPAVVDEDGPLVRITEIVEKPAPEEAPSDLAVIGRYVLPPAVFDLLDHVEPGKGGEIQLTDALQMLVRDRALYGLTFEQGHYDTGNKGDYLRATVELALEREDLGPDFRAFLADLCRRDGLCP
ncbi:MAG TPA: UTP--glucose-1-phosphate uridylyltransferase GalU [Acidimicrobiales bacterium]|nr:UTP--glucose-1-phosphate uridylyltransferase GalU [Acidimicrobiales bacterium]